MSSSHLDAHGRALMVDVSDKPVTAREATAAAVVRLGPAAAMAVREGSVKKGDVLAVAQIAGVMGAKATPGLIPLCHPIAISGVSLEFSWTGDDLLIAATVRTSGQTGVEMEALTAASVAALTVYDMVKSIERGATIESIRLLHKSGGQRGEWTRER